MPEKKGFFVVVKMKKTKAERTWKAELLSPVPGWQKTSGETLEQAIEGQKQQYHAQAEIQKPLPDLTDGQHFPMATGQTVRFVPVAEG